MKRAFAGAEYLGNARRQEILQVVADSFTDAAKLFSRLGDKPVEKVSMNGDPAGCFIKVFKICHFGFEFFGIGQQFIRAEQRHRQVQFIEHFEGVSDMSLSLAFEKSFVTALSQTGSGIHDELGVGGKWDAAVSGQVVAMRWWRLRIRVLVVNLKMNQIVFAVILTGHGRERFPIHALFINAQPAPFRFVLEYLMGELIDAGTGLARTGVTGDEPAATKLVAFPSQAAELCDRAFPSCF